MNDQEQRETLREISIKLSEVRHLLSKLRDAGGEISGDASACRQNVLSVGVEVLDMEIKLKKEAR